MRIRLTNGAVRTSGFTLVEVILAIGIAVGIMMVALVFYHQSANLRAQLIEKAEELSAIRLVMDRVAADLRSAFEQPQIGFTGTSDSMEFVVTRVPHLDGAPARFVTGSDLWKVTYYLTASLEGTNFVVTGLDRTEEPLLSRPISQALADTAVTAMSTLPAAMTGTNGAPAEPLAGEVRFVHFRYWDGVDWLEAWDAPGLPAAVEVSIGAEALPEADLPEAYPYELFRRIVVLSGRSQAAEDWWAGL